MKGYSLETVKGRIYRMDAFYRFVWDNLTDSYTTTVTHEHAGLLIRLCDELDVFYWSSHKETRCYLIKITRCLRCFGCVQSPVFRV